MINYFRLKIDVFSITVVLKLTGIIFVVNWTWQRLIRIENSVWMKWCQHLRHCGRLIM